MLWSAATCAQPAARPALPGWLSADLAQRGEWLRTRWAQLAAQGLSPATTAEPSLGVSKILTPTINLSEAPGAPILQLAVHTGTVGIDIMFAELVSPSGKQSVTVEFGVPFPPGKTDKLQFDQLLQSPFSGEGGFNIYSESGAWTLESVTLLSNDFSMIAYSGSQLASRFPSLTVNVVNNGTPDVTPPKAGKGKILTPSISLGSTTPYFAARLPVSDSNSGVRSVTVSITPPGGSFPTDGAYSLLSAPVKAGEVTAYESFSTSSPIGTYTINSFYVCDYAGNCLAGTSPSDIETAFGATSFQVTQ